MKRKDKVTLTYRDRQLKIMLGKKELPLDKLINPAVIVLSADELPTLRFELLIDDMDIDDIKSFGRYVTTPKGIYDNHCLPEPSGLEK